MTSEIAASPLLGVAQKNKTQRITMLILLDWKPHPVSELLRATKSVSRDAFNFQMVNLRKKLQARDRDIIVSYVVARGRRTAYYRLVSLVDPDA